MNTVKSDTWVDGEAYEHYVGRWSRKTARDFVDWLGVPEGGVWLDLGCGTGALSQTILERASPARVLGVEPSEGFLALAKAQVQDARVSFTLGSGSDLPAESDSFDVVASGYVLNFIPDLAKAFREMKRVVKPGGLVAAYVWDYAGGAEFIRRFWDAAVALDRAAEALDEGKRFPLCQPEELSARFRLAGLQQVEVEALDVATVFKSFDDYWKPFLGGIGPAPGYVASLEDRRKRVLKRELRSTLPTEGDGSIRLLARSWAVRGRLWA